MFRKKSVLQILPPVVLLLDAVISTFARLHAGSRAMAFFDDDFFYYLKVAMNLAAGRGSTFDGIHLTNGYHPLWLLLLTGLVKVFPVRWALIAVLGLICASTLATYGLALSGLKRVVQSPFLASLAATFIALGAMHITYGGMEIVLTIPLALALCWYRMRPSFAWTPTQALLYGLLGSLVVLSRLDSIFFVAPLFFFELVWPGNMDASERPGRAAWLAGGMVPVFLYAVTNLIIFKVAMPVSGMAKQLRIHHAFSFRPFAGMLAWPLIYRLLIVAPTIVIVGFAAALVLGRGWNRLSPSYRPLACALMLLPAIQICSLCWLSDWIIFEWYLYTFILAEFGAALVLCSQDLRLPRFAGPDLRVAAAALLVLLMMVDMASRLRSTEHPERPFYSIYHGSSAVAAFARTHPGVYAMGDRAGMTGFFLREPLIQLEGLVMDKQYLQNIREDRNLNDVLRQYGVTYYVATNPRLNGDCYLVREPEQAGPDSHSMRGTFCQQPLDHYVANGKVTDIFDVREEERANGQ